jgi:hypothetical protein
VSPQTHIPSEDLLVDGDHHALLGKFFFEPHSDDLPTNELCTVVWIDLHMTYVLFKKKKNILPMRTMSLQSCRVPSPRRKRHAEHLVVVCSHCFNGPNHHPKQAAFLFLDDPNLHWSTVIVSLFEPTVFFYQSRKACDALEALCCVGKKLLRVILVELILILTFAVVAHHLYANDESFQNLAQSWILLLPASIFT